ncbi:MAG: hypothetical protein HFI76_01905 [Lachnospiraceae bacterium]|nr:hypothetical protein [Lachnospiraceae bacterium]
MTTNTLEERKRYINQIKASFQEPGKSNQYQDVAPGGEETAPAMGYFKLRLLIAAVLFAAFVYCDKNHVNIYTYTTDQMCEYIQADMDTEQIMEAMKKLP